MYLVYILSAVYVGHLQAHTLQLNNNPQQQNKQKQTQVLTNSDDLTEVGDEEGEAEQGAEEEGKVDEQENRVSEFFSSFINISYVDKKRGVLHSERRDAGRFSSDGPGYAAGIAARLQSQVENASLVDYACTLPLKAFHKEKRIIAIIKRGHCTFDTKVKNAVSAGASGVLIYDNLEEDNLKTIQISPDSVPTVFTYHWFGKQIIGQIELGHRVFVSLEEGPHCRVKEPGRELFCTKGSDWVPHQRVFNNKDPFSKINSDKALEGKASESVLFVSVSFLVLIMISLVWLLFYYIQRFRFIHNKDEVDRLLGRQAKQALSCVTLLVVREGEGADHEECTVCLETMKVGEEVRCLPCSHTFHRFCIDTWLITKRKCPLCNLNIVKHFGLSNLEDSDTSQETRHEIGVSSL